jgi:glycerol-3-phosphate dehydrogenase
MQHQYSWLPKELLLRFAKNYGSRIHLLLQDASSLSDLGEEFAPNLYQKEVEYLITHEWAQTSDDILWRRTKLGLFLTESDTQRLENWLDIY